MTKAEIVTEIAKTTGIDKASVLAVVEGLMTSIKDSLAHGENVYLRGFGSFIVKERKEKTARNISKNMTIIIPAHNIPAFKVYQFSNIANGKGNTNEDFIFIWKSFDTMILIDESTADVPIEFHRIDEN